MNEQNHQSEEKLEENDTIQEDNSRLYRRKSKKRIFAVSAIVVAAVIVLNVAFSALTSHELWFADLTYTRYKSNPSSFYRMTDVFRNLIEDEAIPMIDSVNEEREAAGEDPIKLKIIFCTDPDYVNNNTYLRYVNYTAKGLEKEFPDQIDVQYVNISKNPSAVQKYKITSAATIYSSDVIVEFGTEYIVNNILSFFTSNSDSEAPWAYNGEKRMASAILSVTRAEAPICCITTNHGEPLYDADGNINEEYTAFARTIEGAGYVLQPLDLENEEIPENCRMIITFNPKEDFKAYGSLGENGVSEIEKLDRYLDNAYTFFYVCDRTTPVLTNLEEYLQEWGITVSRVGDSAGTYENYSIKDTAMNVDAGVGDRLLGNYATNGLGASLTTELRSLGYPPSVVFGNSTAISVADNYNTTYVQADETEGTQAYEYYSYARNGVYRYMYDIFTTYDSAIAQIGGETYEMATSENLFKIMTITQEYRQIQEDNYSTVNDASYVLALASTDFVSNEVLNSTAYGNTDVLLSCLRRTSREVIPVNIDLKAFYIYDIDENSMSDETNKAYTVCFAVIPALIVFAVGTVVIVKRKYM